MRWPLSSRLSFSVATKSRLHLGSGLRRIWRSIGKRRHLNDALSSGPEHGTISHLFGSSLIPLRNKPQSSGGLRSAAREGPCQGVCPARWLRELMRSATAPPGRGAAFGFCSGPGGPSCLLRVAALASRPGQMGARHSVPGLLQLGDPGDSSDLDPLSLNSVLSSSQPGSLTQGARPS